MKKWGFLLIFIVLLSITVFDIGSFFRGEKDNEMIYQGNLLLVNSLYPVQAESIKSDIVNLYERKDLVKGYRLFDRSICLSEEIARKFSDMVLDAEKDGISGFLITSGFREFDEQAALFEEMGPDRALPAGYSEHNLGLSLDVGSIYGKMEVAPEGKWIEENAWKYGFILRYPKNKTDITGIMNEPWHIRYVGLPHSVIMKEKDFALEEYLEYLKTEKQISTTVNGQKYDILYDSSSKKVTMNAQDNLHYQVSGNNSDGIIYTILND
ncbi:M15 family metallopeptidase [Bhargavaea beijingensis]|uniref:D-alanyl-D-alanine carboxypeptidase n=1 Tax=Bhargavaea beijingensis TaxID=426756 RepID=A0A1G6YUR2_9BACL|nr:M15 family metallopeptidase [Bhargavaea beijingensis]RSK36633.1 D-alanyl-D-alanine carboxypeptidase family protein [Bhargavaea beijingensis]SDD93326.1 D-alanyl-D-alanine carboxypeptidase [Bhargavaea beijingensis]